MIYSGSPSKHLNALALVIIEKLKTGHRCLYLNSPAMVVGIRSYLAAAGLHVAKELSAGSLVLSSATDHLIDGLFDPKRMLALIGDAVDESLRDGYKGLWATGDMTWELGGEKSFEKLFAYECGLEVMFRSRPALSGICQYHQDTLPEHALNAAVLKHKSMFISETLSRVNLFYSPVETAPSPRIPPSKLKKMVAKAHQAASR
jgi:hypothetical protein